MGLIAEDKIAIAEKIYKYAQGIDTRDWVLYRSIFTDEIHADFSSYNGQPGEDLSADEWVARLQPLFSGLAATQHSMTNPIVTFDEEGAECRMYMQAEHFLDPNDTDTCYAIGGYYTNRFVRHGSDWLINKVRLTILWRKGDAGLMIKAAERGMSKAKEAKWDSWSRPVTK